MGIVNYRAVHTKSLWRKVGTHQSLDAAISGKDGAAALFARKARIDYERHGDPRYVIVWERGASSGFVIRHDANSPGDMEQAPIPLGDIDAFESRGQASDYELAKYFQK
jgi:hypothetical protein